MEADEGLINLELEHRVEAPFTLKNGTVFWNPVEEVFQRGEKTIGLAPKKRKYDYATNKKRGGEGGKRRGEAAEVEKCNPLCNDAGGYKNTVNQPGPKSANLGQAARKILLRLPSRQGRAHRQGGGNSWIDRTKRDREKLKRTGSPIEKYGEWRRTEFSTGNMLASLADSRIKEDRETKSWEARFFTCKEKQAK